MRWMPYTALLLLAGCYTPTELTQDRRSLTFEHQRSVADVADCIHRNADELGGRTFAQRRPGPDGNPEIVVRASAGDVFAVAQVGPQVRVYVSPFVFGEDTFAKAMVKGCL